MKDSSDQLSQQDVSTPSVGSFSSSLYNSDDKSRNNVDISLQVGGNMRDSAFIGVVNIRSTINVFSPDGNGGLRQTSKSEKADRLSSLLINLETSRKRTIALTTTQDEKKVQNHSNKDGRYILKPTIEDPNIPRSNLIQQLDTAIAKKSSNDEKITVSGLISVGKHYFVDDYCERRYKDKIYHYVVWFDKFYDIEEVEKNLKFIKRNYLTEEEQKNLLIDEILVKLSKKIPKDEKLLLVLNCGYFNYGDESLNEARDIFNNTHRKLSDVKIDTIIISHIQQDLSKNVHLVIEKMDEKYAIELIEIIFKKANIKKDREDIVAIVSACLFHPALISQYAKYIVSEKSTSQDYKNTDEFPFPFLITHHDSRPTITSPQPSLPSYPQDFESSYSPIPLNTLSYYSKSNLLTKLPYLFCIINCVYFASTEFKKKFYNPGKQLCVFLLVYEILAKNKRFDVTKDEIKSNLPSEWKDDKDKMVENFIKIAKKFFLICSQEDHKITMQKIVYFGIKHLIK